MDTFLQAGLLDSPDNLQLGLSRLCFRASGVCTVPRLCILITKCLSFSYPAKTLCSSCSFECWVRKGSWAQKLLTTSWKPPRRFSAWTCGRNFHGASLGTSGILHLVWAQLSLQLSEDMPSNVWSSCGCAFNSYSFWVLTQKPWWKKPLNLRDWFFILHAQNSLQKVKLLSLEPGFVVFLCHALWPKPLTAVSAQRLRWCLDCITQVTHQWPQTGF